MIARVALISLGRLIDDRFHLMRIRQLQLQRSNLVIRARRSLIRRCLRRNAPDREDSSANDDQRNTNAFQKVSRHKKERLLDHTTNSKRKRGPLISFLFYC